MKTFDYDQVRAFADQVNQQLDACENGEGMEFQSLDATLGHCAKLCCEFAREIRSWGRGVFSGQIAFDAAAEQLWRAELQQVYTRSIKLLQAASQAEEECWVLEGKGKRQAALFTLSQLSNPWVTPKLAVGPSARQGLSVDLAQEARRRVGELSPLPPDWKPVDQRQEMRSKKVRRK